MGDGEIEVGGGEVLELLGWGGGGDGGHSGADFLQRGGIDGEDEGVEVLKNVVDGADGATGGRREGAGAKVP